MAFRAAGDKWADRARLRGSFAGTSRYLSTEAGRHIDGLADIVLAVTDERVAQRVIAFLRAIVADDVGFGGLSTEMTVSDMEGEKKETGVRERVTAREEGEQVSGNR